MLENTRSDQTINPTPNFISSLPPSLFRRARNWFLSSLVPVGFALRVARALTSPTAERGVFKSYIDELRNGLVIKVGSSQLVSKFLPRYLTQTLAQKMHTGELLEFSEQLEFDLTQAYDLNLDEQTRDLHKQRAFQSILMKLGPHGLKFIQTLRPREINGWIAKVIAGAQSDLPSVTVSEFEHLLKKAFEMQGSLEFVDRFSELVTIKKFFGAGTIGITALVEFRSPNDPSESPKLRVVKLVRPGSLPSFLKDHACFTNAALSLLQDGIITEKEANSFIDFNKIMAEAELRELNLNLEAANLASDPYNSKGVCETVACDLELTGKAQNVVIMDVAPGVPLGRYLQNLSLSLANATSEEEKKPFLDKLAELRSRYVQLALLHFGRAHRNQSLHTDLHPGNLFYDDVQDRLMVLDLGSMTHPLPPAEHLKLNRFVLAFNLSMGTGDSHFLRLYYQNEMKTNPKLHMDKVEPMLQTLQATLDTIRADSAATNIIDVDLASDRAMSVIKDTIISEGVHIVPTALFHTAKANAPVNDALDAMKQILVNAGCQKDIPLSERTQFTVALKASLQARKFKKDVWTQETWDYFAHSVLHPKDGFAQLRFQKKFIYGLFGLDEQEASLADVMIPGTVIAAPVVVSLGAMFLKRMVNTLAVKIPQVVESYNLMQKVHHMYQSGRMSKDEGVRYMRDFFERSRQRYQDVSHRVKPQARGPVEVNVVSAREPMSKTSLLRFKFFSRFVPGVLIGAVGAEIAHQIWDHHNRPPK